MSVICNLYRHAKSCVRAAVAYPELVSGGVPKLANLSGWGRSCPLLYQNTDFKKNLGRGVSGQPKKTTWIRHWADGKMSDYFTCNVGVRQGEHLSPLLFAIYLNYLESYKGLDNLSDYNTGQLSDPYIEVFFTFACTSIKKIMLMILLQWLEHLNNCKRPYYCSLWNLTVNISKTNIVIFSRGKERRYPNFLFGCGIQL